MADVFISYSRTDKDFVHDLQQALAARGREAWVDWRDIPPTAEWLREIYAGIEAASAVVFVLSPEFLASENCSLEVAHAVECKKRLVPVVRREVDPQRVNPVLEALNWIFFRAGDDVAMALTTLLQALDTDLDYDRESARLLVRAREWETRKQVDAAALRGVELEEAERWLAQGANKTPSPTMLQVEYITASRKAAGRRQRRLLTGVSAALAVTIVLTIVSFVLFQVAQARQQEAQTNYAHALARQLAAQSLNSVGNQRDLALLLAAEAYQRDPTSGEAANAMLTALATEPRLAGFVQDYTHQWASVAFSPDGKTLAAGSIDGIITVWDVATRHVVGEPIAADSRDHGPILVTFSPDGRLLGSSGPQQTLQVWDVASHRRVAVSPQLPTSGPLGGIAFSPDGTVLAGSGCGSSTIGGSETHPVVGLWTYASGKVVALPGTGSLVCADVLGGVAFSSDGTLVAAGIHGGTLVWNAQTDQVVAGPLPSIVDQIGTHVGVDTVAFSPDGSLVAAGQCGQPTSHYHSATYCLAGAVQLWSVQTGQLVGTLTGHTTDVLGIAFSADGKELVSASGDNTVILWDVAHRTMLDQFATHPAVTTQLVTQQIALSPHGDLLASASDSDLNISLWNMATAQSLATPLPMFADQPPPSTIMTSDYDDKLTDAAISPSGSLLAASGCTVRSVDGSGPATPGPTSSPTAAVWLWNPITRQQSGELRADANACAQQVAFSPDGRTLALAVASSYLNATDNPPNTSVRLWQTASRQFTGQPWPVTDGLDALAFSPDGKTLAGGGCRSVPALAPQPDLAGEVWLWDVATGHRDQLAWTNHAGCVDALAFSPNGTMLAAGLCLIQGGSSAPCNQVEIQLWDVASRRPLGQPWTGDLGLVDHLWFSPDGKTLAAQIAHPLNGPFAGGTVFWDVASRQQTQALPPSEETAISGDWSLMATASCPPNLSDPALCYEYDGVAIQLRNVSEDHPVGVPLAARGIGATESLLFSPDDTMLMSWSSYGGSLLVWDTNSASWATRICQMVGRNLTRVEWNRYLTAQQSYHPTCPSMPRAPAT